MAVLVQEFDCPGAAIAHFGHGLGDDAAHPVAFLGADDGRGGFFQYFLVTPLQRAVALAEMDRLALAVAEHLEFDMPRIAEILFQIDGVVAERVLRFGPRLHHLRFQLVLRLDHLHAAPASPGGRLDQHRIADLCGDLDRFFHAFDRAVGTRHQRQAELAGSALGLHLVPHQPDMLGAGADPDDIVQLDDLGEPSILGQKPIARMNCIGVRQLGGRNDIGNVEIGIGGGGRADADRLVGQPHVHRIAVGGRMDCDRLDPHFVAGPMDAKRDLAPVGDQDLVERRLHAPTRGSAAADHTQRAGSPGQRLA